MRWSRNLRIAILIAVVASSAIVSLSVYGQGPLSRAQREAHERAGDFSDGIVNLFVGCCPGDDDRKLVFLTLAPAPTCMNADRLVFEPEGTAIAEGNVAVTITLPGGSRYLLRTDRLTIEEAPAGNAFD